MKKKDKRGRVMRKWNEKEERERGKRKKKGKEKN